MYIIHVHCIDRFESQIQKFVNVRMMVTCRNLSISVCGVKNVDLISIGEKRPQRLFLSHSVPSDKKSEQHMNILSKFSILQTISLERD